MNSLRSASSYLFHLTIFLLFTTNLITKASNSQRLLSYAKKEINKYSLPEITVDTLAQKRYSFGDSRRDVQVIIKTLADEKEDIRLKKLALEGLKACISEEAGKEIAQQAKNWKNYNEFTFPVFRDSGVIPDSIWAELIENGDPIIAQVAVESLNETLLQSSNIEKSLLKRIVEKKTPYYLKLATIEKLQEYPTPQFIKSLVKILKKDGVGEMALDALTATTGQDFKYSPNEWNMWLSRSGGTDLQKIAKDPLKTSLIEQAYQQVQNDSNYPERYRNELPHSSSQQDLIVETPPLYKRDKDRPSKSLYGEKVEGQNLLFFLDCSGSMHGPPFDVLSDQMLYMAQTLGDNYNIGVVFFPFEGSSSILKYSKNNMTFQNRLRKFLSKKSKGGGSSLIGAMEYSYRKLISRYSPVDTIYVISDGLIGNSNERAMVYNLNANERIRINTITIGKQSVFMSGLALDNFGRSLIVQ
jgi:hypothetical protein